MELKRKQLLVLLGSMRLLDEKLSARLLFAEDAGKFEEKAHPRGKGGRFVAKGSGETRKQAETKETEEIESLVELEKKIARNLQRASKKRELNQKGTIDNPEKNSKVTGCKDITKDFIKKSTPGKGTFRIDSNVNIAGRSEDIKMARWLFKNFGGDIVVLSEDQKESGKKNPDYLWNGKLWDLKTPDNNSFNAINKRTQSGVRQIRSNPGGIIMDLNKCDMSIKEAMKAINNRMFTSADFEADVIIIHKGEEFSVIHYK